MKEISLTFLDLPQEITTIHVGTIDSQAIRDRVTSLTSTKRQPNYHKWTEKERYTIGKYAAENGNINAVRKFKLDFPALGESSVRSFKTKYYEELKYKTKEDCEASQSIRKYSRQTGRPYLLGDLDEMVKTYLLTLSKRGGVINTTVANETAKALMSKYPHVVGEIDVDSSRWAKSLFTRMNFVKRGKPRGHIRRCSQRNRVSIPS